MHGDFPSAVASGACGICHAKQPCHIPDHLAADPRLEVRGAVALGELSGPLWPGDGLSHQFAARVQTLERVLVLVWISSLLSRLAPRVQALTGSGLGLAGANAAFASALSKAAKFLVKGSDAGTAPQSPPNWPRRNNTVSENVAPSAACCSVVNANVGSVLSFRVYFDSCAQGVG